MRLVKLPPFENVGAGQTAIMPRIPQGETYEGIVLKLGGTFTKAQIDNIRQRLGGKLITDITGSHLDSINKYMGQTANASYLAIHYSDPNARTINGENIGAIDTSTPYSSFAMEVDINSGATSPTLEAWGLVSEAKGGKDQKVIKTLLKNTETVGGAGTFNLNIPTGSRSGTLIKRVHMFHANITEFTVKRDGFDIQDQGENGVIQFLQNELTRTTQSGHLAYDPLVRDNQSNAIPTARPDGNPASMEFKATASASDTVTEYAELYATVDRI